MLEDDTDDTEYVEVIGVVLARSPDNEQQYDVYKISVSAGDNITLSPVSGATGRTKKSAVKLAQLALVDISHAISRGLIEFYTD